MAASGGSPTVPQPPGRGDADLQPLYPDSLPLIDKIRTTAQPLYGPADIAADDKITRQLTDLEEDFGHFPICMAKTQFSFSADPALKGAPSGHVLPVREVRLSGGAEFIVAVCGDIMTMPGLPRVPAANAIGVNESGGIVGLS